VTNNINQVLFGAVWPILGEHAQAGSGSIWPFSITGHERDYGTFTVHILPHGGRGAMQDMDGMIPIAFPHNSSVTPTEVMETQAPILMLKKELLPDSAGPGRRRGGVGQVIVFRNIGKEPMSARVRPDKMFCAPPGIDGGEPGRTGEVRMNGQSITRFPPLEFNPGDEIEMRMPGGAGFGHVSEREQERITRDLELGYISIRGARADYGLDSPTTTGKDTA
jgi:N-methylhydantoinase B